MAESYAVMPLPDYEAACDAIREKTGGIDPITSGDMAAQIQGISVGDDFAITDASYLFYQGARYYQMQEYMNRIRNCTTMRSMFYSCYYQRKGSPDLSMLDTSQCTSMNSMFYQCDMMENIDLSNFDTHLVTDMNSMFYRCGSLTSLDVGSFDTSNVTNMSGMFQQCSKLTSLNLSNFDTSKASSMNSMFSSSNKLEALIGFSAVCRAGLSIGFPNGNSSSSRAALKRLTFRTDLPDGQYAIRSAINIKYCSFERSGMVEMFGTLPDVSALGLTATQTTITITGNPCVTDGTLTDADRSIATGKGWTLVE